MVIRISFAPYVIDEIELRLTELFTKNSPCDLESPGESSL